MSRTSGHTIHRSRRAASVADGAARRYLWASQLNVGAVPDSRFPVVAAAAVVGEPSRGPGGCSMPGDRPSSVACLHSRPFSCCCLHRLLKG